MCDRDGVSKRDKLCVYKRYGVRTRLGVCVNDLSRRIAQLGEAKEKEAPRLWF